jgi:YHS domain-containing protein
MTVDEAEAAASHEHDGVTYYFCNERAALSRWLAA